MRLGIRRVLFILPLLVLVFTGALALWRPTPEASADSSVFSTNPWYDSAGNKLNNITNKSFAARFTFTDTATIVDVQTQTQYVLSGADPALEFNHNHVGDCTDIAIYGGCTDVHNTYVDSSSGSHPKTYYWYWPTTESDKNGQAPNGKCMGGFLISDDSSANNTYLYINFIPTVSNSTGCNVYDQSSGSVPTGPMNDDDFHNYYAGVQKGIHDDHNPVQDPSINQYASTQDFAGYVQWSNADQLSIIAGASPAFELVTDQDEINHIHSHLLNGQSHASDYADTSKYNYFAADSCGSSGGNFSVFLAVPTSGGVGSDIAYILHDDAPDADDSSDKAYGDWSGKDYNCLFGNSDEDHNPIELLSGNSDNSDIQVILTSTQNASKTLATYTGPTPSTPPGSGSAKAPTLDCHVKFYNPLSWFLCPLASGLASVAGGLDNAADT